MYKTEVLKNLEIFNIIKVVDFKDYNQIRVYYINNTDEIFTFSSFREFNDFKNMLNNILNNPNNDCFESNIN